MILTPSKKQEARDTLAVLESIKNMGITEDGEFIPAKDVPHVKGSHRAWDDIKDLPSTKRDIEKAKKILGLK